MKSSTGIKRGKRAKPAWSSAIDLYSGPAAVAPKRARSQVVDAVDNNAVACATYKPIHPQVQFYETDIRALDLTMVGAPCQSFSGRNQNKQGDTCTRFPISTAQFSIALKPRTVFIENVPGPVSKAIGGILSDFNEGCGENYRLGELACLDAADFGVAQSRERCLPNAARGTYAPCIPPPVTPNQAKCAVRNVIKPFRPPSAPDEVDPEDCPCVAHTYRPIIDERLRAIPKDGGEGSQLPSRLAPDCHNYHKNHPDEYGRMGWDDVAPTLTTGCADGTCWGPRISRMLAPSPPKKRLCCKHFSAITGLRIALKVIAEQIGSVIPFGLLHTPNPTFLTALKQQTSRILTMPDGRS